MYSVYNMCKLYIPQTAQSSLRVELSEAHRERGQMEASLRGYRTQEQDYKRCVLPSLEGTGVVNFIFFLKNSVSTIQKLEEKARHLQHVNNRLHGQATHYSLGSAGAISTHLSISPPS